LEKTTKIIKPNHQPNTTMPTTLYAAPLQGLFSLDRFVITFLP